VGYIAGKAVSLTKTLLGNTRIIRYFVNNNAAGNDNSAPANLPRPTRTERLIEIARSTLPAQVSERLAASSESGTKVSNGDSSRSTQLDGAIAVPGTLAISIVR